jgi:hypothetical protein
MDSVSSSQIRETLIQTEREKRELLLQLGKAEKRIQLLERAWKNLEEVVTRERWEREKLKNLLEQRNQDPYAGLAGLQIKSFAGDKEDYSLWKVIFKKAYEGRGIPPVMMALFLMSKLEGDAYKLCRRFGRTGIDDHSYAQLFEALDRRYQL